MDDVTLALMPGSELPLPERFHREGEYILAHYSEAELRGALTWALAVMEGRVTKLSEGSKARGIVEGHCAEVRAALGQGSQEGGSGSGRGL